MIEIQKTENIAIDELYARCASLKFGGWRLVQIGCTGTPDGMEINYTFDKDYEFLNLRILCPSDQTVPSIQSVYSCAFAYENEMLDLFGVKVTDMLVDFNGKFYKITTPTPFNELGNNGEANR